MIRSRFRLPAWVTWVLRAAITVGLLVFLWRMADGPVALAALVGANWLWLALAVLCLKGQTVLSALRWRLAAGQLGIRLGAARAVGEYYLGLVVNQVLPGGMLGDAARAVRAGKQAGLMASGQAVVFERLAGQAALFVVLGFVFLGTLLVPGGFDWPGWLIGPVALLVLLAASAPLVVWAGTAMPGRVGRVARAQVGALRTALLAPGVWQHQLALSIGTTCLNLAAFGFCVRAVGAELTLIELIALTPLILVTMMIPLSVSGWGLREGAAALLLPLAGVAASTGFAASVAFGLMFLLSVLPGVGLVALAARGNAGGTDMSLPRP